MSCKTNNAAKNSLELQMTSNLDERLPGSNKVDPGSWQPTTWGRDPVFNNFLSPKLYKCTNLQVIGNQLPGGERISTIESAVDFLTEMSIHTHARTHFICLQFYMFKLSSDPGSRVPICLHVYQLTDKLILSAAPG